MVFSWCIYFLVLGSTSFLAGFILNVIYVTVHISWFSLRFEPMLFLLHVSLNSFFQIIKLYLCMNVVQTVVGMLREVIDSEHEVFVFKLVIFVLATLERGNRENVVRFVQAGGAAVMVSLMVLSAEKVAS
jgi:hypothetical protein